MVKPDQSNIYCLITNQTPALLVQHTPWTRAAVMLGQSLYFSRFLPNRPPLPKWFWHSSKMAARNEQTEVNLPQAIFQRAQPFVQRFTGDVSSVRSFIISEISSFALLIGRMIVFYGKILSFVLLIGYTLANLSSLSALKMATSTSRLHFEV